MSSADIADRVALTARILAAYCSNNRVSASALPELIRAVGVLLSDIVAGKVGPSPGPVHLVPAVPIKRSVFPDYIVCLEDGLKLKTLKRHLRTSYGMTLEQYRKRWGLPAEYPVVAPNYASRRSVLAKQAGLGGRRHVRRPPEASGSTGMSGG